MQIKVEDELYLKVEAEVNQAKTTQQSELSIPNVVEVRYGINKRHFGARAI